MKRFHWKQLCCKGNTKETSSDGRERIQERNSQECLEHIWIELKINKNKKQNQTMGSRKGSGRTNWFLLLYKHTCLEFQWGTYNRSMRTCLIYTSRRRWFHHFPIWFLSPYSLSPGFQTQWATSLPWALQGPVFSLLLENHFPFRSLPSLPHQRYHIN